MKKFIVSALSAVLLGTLITGNVSGLEAKKVTTEHGLIDMVKGSLISDGNFEAGGSAWNKRNKGKIAEGVSYDGGTKSGLVPADSKDGSNNVSGYIGQSITVTPNTEYIIKAYAKTDVEGSRGIFSARPTDIFPVIQEVPITSTEWQEYILTINSGSNSTMLIQLVKWADTGDADYTLSNSANVYIDNVTIEKKGETPTDEQYEMVWADDFNQSKLDASEWGYELGSIRGVEQQHYVKSEKNTFMRDGKLVLKATDRAVEDQYKNPRGPRQVIYDSGSVRTHGKQEFLYGRIEMKAKLPKGKGVFPAFWTLGSNFTLDGDISDMQGNPWSRCGEIDIMELTGGPLGTVHNKQAWGTPHFYHPNGETDLDSTGSRGKAYEISEDYNNAYHVFGVNWSPDKIEWYVDGVIYNTLDFSDPTWGKYAKMSYSQPQYIQFNLAMGGNWPGDAGTDLNGTEFDIDYVYYAQNAEQKAAAKAYYDAAPSISGLKDMTMTQGEMPNLLKDITSDKDSYVDFSIDNEYMFKNEGGLTNVDRVCSGKEDSAKLAKLPAGKYNIHYTAIPNNVEFAGGVPNRENEYKMTRRTVLLTVGERVFPTDVTLNGVYGEKLSTVTLPAGWAWDNSEKVMTNSDIEYAVNYESNGFTTTAKVKVQLNGADKVVLKDTVSLANTYVDEDVYTSETLNVLKAKIVAAQAIVDKTDATKAEVAKVTSELKAAIDGLVKKPIDKTELKAKITFAKTYLDKDVYTSESLNILQAKIAAAQAVMDKADATKAEVMSAVNDLSVAITGLKKKPGTPPVEDIYEIIEDKKQTVEQGKSIIFKSNASIEKFKEVLIDGKVLDKAHYTVKEGSTIIVLDAEYTKLLSSGVHTITIVSTDGNATTQFSVEADSSGIKPETSDKSNIALFTSLTTLAFAGIWAMFRKKEVQ